MENRHCNYCVKPEFYDSDIVFPTGEKIFCKGDRIRELFSAEEALTIFGRGAVRILWDEKTPDHFVFCRKCILEICQKKKAAPKPKKEENPIKS